MFALLNVELTNATALKAAVSILFRDEFIGASNALRVWRCERERPGWSGEPLDPTLEDGKKGLGSSEFLARGCQQRTNSIEGGKLKQVIRVSGRLTASDSGPTLQTGKQTNLPIS
jgi:hypothetical protein